MSNPTGGSGSYTYQWQQKQNGDWADISNAISTNYQPNALVSTTSYRLKIVDTCSVVYSNEVTIQVRPALTAPKLSYETETICYNVSPSLLSVSEQAIGGVDDTFTYQWQESSNGLQFTDISGATGLTYQPISLTSDRYYRVVATSTQGCGSIISSNFTKIIVLPDLHIITEGTNPLCYMSSGTIKVNATGAGDSYTYQWQESSDGVSFSNIAQNSTLSTYTTPAKPSGTYYYRCVVSSTFGCADKISDIISVQVYTDLVAGVIEGGATICYNTKPGALSLVSNPTGGDGKYSYKWMQKVGEATTFSYISNATNITYQPSELTQTTQYKLEITNSCGVVETNVVTIYVRDQLVAPIINCLSDTICQQTAPNVISMVAEAKGGIDDSFDYQWEMSTDGVTFIKIVGENSTIYQPGVQVDKRYYRVCATSVQGCGSVNSNIVEVNVFDDINILVSPMQNLCYMDVAEISVSVTGGGGEYLYQWQESTDNVNYNDISCITSKYTSMPLNAGTYYYRCIVTANRCGNFTRISESIKINVYSEIKVGELGSEQEVCYGEDANPLEMLTPTTGSVLDNVQYTWFVLYEGESDWKKIAETKEDTYTPQHLTKSGKYRLQLITICDTVYTNAVDIKVNPLPEIQNIIGATDVCYNQYETYAIDVKNGFSYDWILKNNHGMITSESDDKSSVEILWQDENVSDSLLISITNMTTGCVQEVGMKVNICGEKAPDRTIVVRKPNSNILVAQESADLYYQWGYTRKSTKEDTFVDNSNQRYVMLPHLFDNTIYDYWLLLRTTESSPCYSKSIYLEENDALISTKSSYVSVPSLIRGVIPMVVHNDANDLVECSIYTIDGLLIFRYDLGAEQLIDIQMPFVAPKGMYIMNVQIGNIIETFKLIAE